MKVSNKYWYVYIQKKINFIFKSWKQRTDKWCKYYVSRSTHVGDIFIATYVY